MRKMHRTMRGHAFDMEDLRNRNSHVVAASPEGAMRMNARGDLLGMNGQIVKTREEIAQEYHDSRPDVDYAYGMNDRLRQLGVPTSPIDPNFFKRTSPQSFDNIDFKTPEQIIAETQAAAAQMQAMQQAAREPNPTPDPAGRPAGRKGKLVQKDD